MYGYDMLHYDDYMRQWSVLEIDYDLKRLPRAMINIFNLDIRSCVAARSPSLSSRYGAAGHQGR